MTCRTTHLHTQGERPFSVVESLLQAKKDESDNEDGLCLTPWFAAVIDGATAKTDFRPCGLTPGRLATKLVAEAITLLPREADAAQTAAFITAHMAQFCREYGLAEAIGQAPERRPTASAAIFSRFRQQIWLVGDCQCLVDGAFFGNAKPADRILADMRSLILEMELADGKTTDELRQNDTGRAFILPALRRQTKLQNRPDTPLGYAVFDGTPLPADCIVTVPASHATEIVLATDGYPKLLPTLAESERYLAQLLADDPLCFRAFKSTKGLQAGNRSFDDRAYLRILIR